MIARSARRGSRSALEIARSARRQSRSALEKDIFVFLFERDFFAYCGLLALVCVHRARLWCRAGTVGMPHYVVEIITFSVGGSLG